MKSSDLSPEERLTLRGLVLQEYEEKGANRTLAILTAERGMLRAAAFGSGKAQSTLAGATQLYTYSEFSLLARRGGFRVEEAAVVAQFRELTQDFVRFSLAAYFGQLLTDAAPAGLPAPESLKLALRALYTQSLGKQDTELVRAAFTLRLMSLAGFAPELGGEGPCFLPSEGRFADRGVRVTPGAAAAMRHIVDAPTEKVFAFTLGGESLETLAEACEQYTAVCSEHAYGTLDYYKKLLV